ncbi:uncharacterized protein LOC141714312 [Apium graveolens]|uniref:uncharacterized protein LOC141714312 n=1 Tax=Apium graveolens TaxID=4045 RepID=UPI003D7942F3
MSLLSWNFRGLGNPRAVQFLQEIIFQKRPKVIFLCETLSNKSKVDCVRQRLGYEGIFVVEARVHSGGMAMLWKKEGEAKLLNYGNNHIDLVVNMDGLPEFRVTGFYGELKRSLRRNTWNLIRRLAGESELPWCIIGDLNNMLSPTDKKGGNKYPSWLLRGFQEVLDECNLIDMELVGYPFTWEKGKGTSLWVEERLDRALISHSWNLLFPTARLVNLEISTSDHCPLWLDPVLQEFQKSVKHFRFENAWLREPMCHQIVQSSWELFSEDSFQKKIKCCSTSLAKWGKEITENFKERIAKLNKVLRRVKSRRDVESVKRYKDTHEQLCEVLNQKEIFWRQRAKQLWMRSGDQNTKYFHACASKRRKRNQISNLKNNDGVWVGWDIGLPKLVVDYFDNVFKASNTHSDAVTKFIQEGVSNEQNLALQATVEESEVRAALF